MRGEKGCDSWKGCDADFVEGYMMRYKTAAAFEGGGMVLRLIRGCNSVRRFRRGQASSHLISQGWR